MPASPELGPHLQQLVLGVERLLGEDRLGDGVLKPGASIRGSEVYGALLRTYGGGLTRKKNKKKQKWGKGCAAVVLPKAYQKPSETLVSFRSALGEARTISLA